MKTYRTCDHQLNIVLGRLTMSERAYPVPNPEHPGDPTEAEVVFQDLGEGEGFLGKYGELRLDLARHLLKALSK